MIMRFWKWLMDETPYECSSCKLLRDLLEAERDAKDRILRQLLSITAPKEVIRESITEPKIEVNSKAIPWNLRRQILEENDKAAARLAKEQAKVEKPKPVTQTDIEKIEAELGVN